MIQSNLDRRLFHLPTALLFHWGRELRKTLETKLDYGKLKIYIDSSSSKLSPFRL